MAHLIKDLTILLLVSLPINIIFHRVKLPSVMGFLIAGVIIGPHGLQMIGDPQSVEVLAEIGVILLLFVIGLEFSIGRMLKKITTVAGVGTLQLGLTGAAVFGVCRGMGLSNNEGIVLALLIALSSTAIVLKMITDRAEIDTPHGQICIGVLLFQDLCVVPMMLIIPLLSQAGGVSGMDFGIALVKSLAAVSAIFFLSRLMVPRVLEMIARTGSKEHLTLFVILIVLGTGWVSHTLGLSLAMGAFIAGLIISESEYIHQIILDILPLKDYFGSIFFISIGMLLNIQNLADSFLFYSGLTVGMIAVKAVLASLASKALGNSARISFIVGIRLAQVGEFSLILANLALLQGTFSETQYQSFLSVCILSMLAAPILIQYSSGLSIQIFSRGVSDPDEEKETPEGEELSGHVIIAGYGLIGRNLSGVLREINIPFRVLELDGERIKRALTEKVPVLYGDCTRRDTLIQAGVKQARMMVFCISDHYATEHAVKMIRQLNPDIYILVRTRYATQVEGLNAAGADQVIPEEFETSIEIFSRVLREYHIPNNIIEQQVELVRMEGYGMFRGLSLNVESLRKFSTYLAASLTESFHVLPDSWSNHKTLEDLDLNARTGARLIAVVRDNELHANPDSEFKLEGEDIIVLFGRHVQLDRAVKMLHAGPEKE
ncbi:MAG: cation:proton antiporter [Nitrospinaceae bacterium]